MEETPRCPACGRPLQRRRVSCIYCGRALNPDEREALERALDDAAVQRRLQQVDAVLEGGTPKQFTDRGRLIARIVVIALSLAGMVFISWISNWDMIVSAVAVAFFALPIWQIMTKL